MNKPVKEGSGNEEGLRGNQPLRGLREPVERSTTASGLLRTPAVKRDRQRRESFIFQCGFGLGSRNKKTSEEIPRVVECCGEKVQKGKKEETTLDFRKPLS